MWFRLVGFLKTGQNLAQTSKNVQVFVIQNQNENTFCRGQKIITSEDIFLSPDDTKTTRGDISVNG